MGNSSTNINDQKNVSSTELINNLYNIMMTSTDNMITQRTSATSNQSNNVTIKASGKGSSIDGVNVTYENVLKVKQKLYANLQEIIQKASTTSQDQDSIIQQIQQATAKTTQENNGGLPKSNKTKNVNRNVNETYLKNVQTTMNAYLTKVCNKIENNQDLDFSQTNSVEIEATDGAIIKNVHVEAMNDEETEFEQSVEKLYDEYIESFNQQSSSSASSSDQSSSSDTEQKNSNKTMMIVIAVVCGIIGVVIIGVVIAAVKNPDGVKAIGSAAKDVASVSSPAGAAMSAAQPAVQQTAAAVVGGLKEISKEAAKAIIVVLVVVIVIGMVLIITGAVNYIIVQNILTQSALMDYVYQSSKLQNDNPGDEYTSDQLYDNYMKKANGGNIAEMVIGSIMVVAGTIICCYYADKWNKQGLITKM